MADTFIEIRARRNSSFPLLTVYGCEDHEVESAKILLNFIIVRFIGWKMGDTSKERERGEKEKKKKKRRGRGRWREL